MHEVEIIDYFAAGVPPHSDPHNPALLADLSERVLALVWSQYPDRGLVPPLAIHFQPVDWCITNDPDEVLAFQPAHDCAACKAGNDQALAFLREHPDRYVVLGNLFYTEVWP